MQKPQRIFYICDASKNTECPGNGSDHCKKQDGCFCTTNPFLAEPLSNPITTNEEYERIALIFPKKRRKKDEEKGTNTEVG